jgi:hypothetical protein
MASGSRVPGSEGKRVTTVFFHNTERGDAEFTPSKIFFDEKALENIVFDRMRNASRPCHVLQYKLDRWRATPSAMILHCISNAVIILNILLS